MINLKEMKSREDYEYVFISKDDPYFPTCMIFNEEGGWIALHRLVMAEKLGRNLRREDIVHHIDKNKQNNDSDNLELTTYTTHWAESFYPKENLKYPCLGCSKQITAGEKAVASRHRATKNIITSHCYHIECYKLMKWEKTHISIAELEAWFEQHPFAVPKQGGRRKAIPGKEKERNALVSLLNYHRKKGHIEEMEELQKRKDTLEIHSKKKSEEVRVIEGDEELETGEVIIY